jgi:hypothetical protein
MPPIVTSRRHATSQEEFVESQFTDGLTIGRNYEPWLPDDATSLEDVQSFAGFFESGKIVPTFGAFRHIEVTVGDDSGKVRLMIMRGAIAKNNLVAGA